jgi:hypothetical protein
MTSHPYALAERERKARWARRDLSMHPLTDMEKAERRHHKATMRWAASLWLGPIGIAMIVGTVFDEIQTPGLVVCTMAASWILAVVAYLFLNAVSAYVGPDTLFWINALSITLTATLLLAAMLTGTVGTLISPPPFNIAGTLICAMALPFWPFLWRQMRGRFATDYERMLDQSNAPHAGIIE